MSLIRYQTPGLSNWPTVDRWSNLRDEINSLFESPFFASMPMRQAQLFNDVLRRQGERYGVELVDLYTASQRETPQHPEWLSGDAYHPSDAGYARWAEIMWEGVAARME